jgi:hypothetical protein
MKRLNENKVDKLFSDGLTGAENPIPFHEEDWKAMEKLLDKKSNKKVVAFRWIYYASGIAAMLLVAFGLFLMMQKDKAITRQNRIVKQSAVKPGYDKTEKNNDPSGQQHVNPVSALSASPQIKGSGVTNSRNSNPFLSLSAARKGRYYSQPKTEVIIPIPLRATTADSTLSQPETLAAATPVAPAEANTNIDTSTVAAKPDNVKPTRAEKKNIRPITGSRPQFTLSILAAPDVNGVGSLGRSQVGTNFGVVAGVQFKKLSISTGIAYAVKPYQASNADYSSSFRPSITTTNIAANCKVLDIPVNLSYQVYNKGQNAFAIGTGLSSYLMLREHYRFDYEYNPEVQPFNLDISNQNRHWFGVLNLNVTYQRQMNSRFNLLVQPYYKLPLTGIGNGKVDLQSAGVALGVSWNINPFRKPQ